MGGGARIGGMGEGARAGAPARPTPLAVPRQRPLPRDPARPAPPPHVVLDPGRYAASWSAGQIGGTNQLVLVPGCTCREETRGLPSRRRACGGTAAQSTKRRSASWCTAALHTRTNFTLLARRMLNLHSQQRAVRAHRCARPLARSMRQQRLRDRCRRRAPASARPQRAGQAAMRWRISGGDTAVGADSPDAAAVPILHFRPPRVFRACTTPRSFPSPCPQPRPSASNIGLHSTTADHCLQYICFPGIKTRGDAEGERNAWTVGGEGGARRSLLRCSLRTLPPPPTAAKECLVSP